MQSVQEFTLQGPRPPPAKIDTVHIDYAIRFRSAWLISIRKTSLEFIVLLSGELLNRDTVSILSYDLCSQSSSSWPILFWIALLTKKELIEFDFIRWLNRCQ